eukprot:11372134-Ditylum_brightwellii.AAC.1
MTVLPDGTPSLFGDDAVASQNVDDISRAIIALQCKGENEMSSIIVDMWIFNKETKAKFQPYWDAIVAVLEEQNGAGAHKRNHAASDAQTTTDLQRAATKNLIEEKKMQEGVDFK